MAIRAALIFNNHGKPRLTKFYSQLPTSRQQALIQRTFALVHRRTTQQATTSSGHEVCNFLDAPDLRPLLPPPATRVNTSTASTGGQDDLYGDDLASSKKKSTTSQQQYGLVRGKADDDQLRVIYRHYATLYFVFIVDESESELGILDLIQVFVEALDRSFENVCELDLIFHFEEVHAILDEIIQGGLVLETNIAEIAASVQAASKARKLSAAQGASTAGGLNSAWTPPPGLGGLPWEAVSNVGGWARGWSSRLGGQYAAPPASGGYR
jgi:AP-3 complex subunit sigma